MANPPVPLQKHTLNLREGDFDKLTDMFPHIPASQTIRLVLSRFIDLNYVEGEPVKADNLKIDF